MKSLAMVVVLSMTGCAGDEIVWVPFNFELDSDANRDEIVVIVTQDAPASADPVEVELTSSTGRTVVGSAVAEPGVAELGSTHELVVEVDDAFEGLVGRASVVVDYVAGDLDGDGEPDAQTDEFEMRRDSADPGLYVVTLQSNGVLNGPEREDVFEIRLWQPEALAGTVDADAEGDEITGSTL